MVVMSPSFVIVQVIHDDIPAVIVRNVHDDITAVLSLSRMFMMISLLSLSGMFMMISLLFCHCPGCSWWYPCCFVIVQDVHDDILAVLSLSRMFMMISLLFCHCPGCSWWYPCCFVIVQDVHDDITAVLSLSRMFMMISLLSCCPGCSWWYPCCLVVQEVEKRFPDGLPLLDPIEDMGIKEKGLQEVIKVRFIDLHGSDLWSLCAGSSFFSFSLFWKKCSLV